MGTMPTFSTDPAVDRFIDALLRLEPQRWPALVDASLQSFREDRQFLATVQRAVSASERSALDRHTKERVRGPLGAVADDQDLNFARMMNPVARGVCALQKRETIGPGEVRAWFALFEPFGIRYEDLVEGHG